MTDIAWIATAFALGSASFFAVGYSNGKRVGFRVGVRRAAFCIRGAAIIHRSMRRFRSDATAGDHWTNSQWAAAAKTFDFAARVAEMTRR